MSAPSGGPPVNQSGDIGLGAGLQGAYGLK